MMLYERVTYGATEIPYFRTFGESANYAEVASESRPVPILLTVDRGEVFTVQSSLETRGFRCEL